MFSILGNIWSLICFYGLCRVCLGKRNVKVGSMSLPALPEEEKGFATSVVEYDNGRGGKFFPNVVPIIKTMGKGQLHESVVGSLLKKLDNLNSECLSRFGMSFAAVFAIVSGVEKVLMDASFVRKVGHIHPDGIMPSEFSVMTFADFFARVRVDTAGHYGLEPGVFPEEVSRGFAKLKKEKFADKTFTDDDFFAMIVALDYFYYIAIHAGVSEENTIEMIEAHIRRLHAARSKEALEQKIRDTVMGLDICYVTEGKKSILEEILRGSGRVVYGPDEGSLIVVNPAIVTDVNVFQVDIRVGKDEMTIDPSKNNECTAATATIHGNKVLLFNGHFKSGKTDVATRERENFEAWYRTYMAEHHEVKYYFGSIDTNIPRGFALPEIDGVTASRTVAATSKKRRIFTSQWKKCGDEVEINYDVGHCASRDGSMINNQEIVGNGQSLPSVEHPFDHPVLKWDVEV